MDSLDAFIYQQLWSYCLRKNPEAGTKAVYRKYTLPPHLRQVGYFQLGIVFGNQAVRIPRLCCIRRKALQLGYPPHPYLLDTRTDVLVNPETTDERWWDQHVWAGQEGERKGQRRFAVEVLARDAVCQICGAAIAQIAHHEPAWSETQHHTAQAGQGVCVTCHHKLHSVGG
ncbi:MAG TPA: hypothetical protein VFU22_11795 [Roseiflexaceae bacterium]|nr:hypothetical protein [Roseiflexaceae bacterium]